MSGGDRGGISDKEKGLAAEALSKGRHYYSCKGGILEIWCCNLSYLAKQVIG